MTERIIVGPTDRTPRTGLYRMAWEDDGAPVGDGIPVEYRFVTGRKVPATNKPGQVFIFQRYISPRDWKVLKKSRKAEMDRARAAARRRRGDPPDWAIAS